MRRLNDNEIILTNEELANIQYFITSSLDRAWDRHTDHYICTDKWEDGVRRMDPAMYDMAQAIDTI